MTHPEDRPARALPPELDPRGRGRRGRRARLGTGARLLRGLAVVTSFVVLVGSGVGYGLVRHFQGNLTVGDVSSFLGSRRPGESQGGAVNYLLIGSDSRTQSSGDAAAGGGGYVEGARSDTTIILHVSPGQQKAVLVSIPRDSYVPLPACTDPNNGHLYPAHSDKFNAAYSEGGAGCTIKTVEQDTGVRIDHYAEIDFAGFQKMVDAIGGVTVCLPQPINDPAVNGHGTGLHLTAGTHTLNGKTALDFVRARYGIGGGTPLAGSDLARIQNQQQFLGALIRQAVTWRLDKLYGFLDAMTKAITVDPGLDDLGRLKALALSVRSFDPAHVTFVTVPLATTDATRNINGAAQSVVLWDTAAATELFDSLKQDTAVGGARPPSPAPTNLTIPADRIRLLVLNGSGRSGAAAPAAHDHTPGGVQITGPRRPPTTSPVPASRSAAPATPTRRTTPTRSSFTDPTGATR